jgi:TetR/AcrR family transcriptional regulator of autoinduction and epiphytic fitness
VEGVVKRAPIPPGLGLADDPTGFQPGVGTDHETDGRRRRRVYNREAVVDALLDLYAEGNLRPSTDEIAERAGLSPRSVFRYFDDVDDLASAAVARQQARAVPLLPLSVGPEESRPLRIKALADQRFRLFDEVRHAGVVTRLRAPFQPIVAALLADNRAFLREQVRELFAREFGTLGPARAREVLASLDILTSYESTDLLLRDQGLTLAQAKSAMVTAIAAVLDAAVGSDGSAPR